MASSDLVILLSSPSRSFATCAMSSSPLPSPTQLFKEKTANFHAHSNHTLIPSTISSSVTTASALLKAADANLRSKSHNSDVEQIDLGDSHRPTANVLDPQINTSLMDNGAATLPKPARKRKVKITAVDDSERAAEPKKARKPRAKKTGEIVALPGEGNVAVVKKVRVKKTIEYTAGEVKELPVRKPRTKKIGDQSQTAIPRDKIAKPSVRRTKKGPSELEGVDQSADLGLVEAVKRKTAWTPPATTMTSIAVEKPPVLNFDVDADTMSPSMTDLGQGFGNLLGKFGFTDRKLSATLPSLPIVARPDKTTTRKRKLIELVSTSNSVTAVSPVKKATKKKPRTITELAIAAYAESDEPSDPQGLLQFFGQDTDSVLRKDKMKKSKLHRSKSPQKGTKMAPILLSPESAMKQVAKQDFIFGTSSQLAREDSPTLLRDLHEAIQASMNHSDPLEALVESGSHETKNDLWKAASRGVDGELLEIRRDVNSVPARINQTAGDSRPDDESFVDLETLINEKDMDELPTPSAQAKVPTPEPVQKNSPPKLDVFKDSAPAKGAKKKPATKKKTPEMPNFASYTTAQLAKEVASYRFKPVKSRDGMISLLEKCWEGKQQAALLSREVNLPKASPEKKPKAPVIGEGSPKRPRGRPRKDTSTTPSPTAKVKRGRPKKSATISEAEVIPKIRTPKKILKAKDCIEEISDSDVPLTPSPPRRRASQVGQPPSQLQLSAHDLEESSPARTSSQEQAFLFEHITKAVTSAPRASDSMNPSWHEKILLYDPIVLEDLAVWLNTGALGNVGWDGEVAPSEVKKWCESKSICCLWKENLRGGMRSRY